MVEILREKILSRQSALFVEVLIIMKQNVSKGSERKWKNLVQLVIWTTDVWNVRLGNILDVDPKTTQLQIFQIHINKMKKGKSKYVLMKKVIMHVTT